MADPEQELRRARVGYAALRIFVSALLVVHGMARVSLSIVDDFGGFLDSVGLPFGVVLAWGLTVFEIVGGAVLAAGRAVRLIACVFICELTAGVALVHAPEGWFVVGAGRGGMEYSALLIVVLAVVAWQASPQRGLLG